MITGRKLATWFHKHHGPLLRADLTQAEARITDALDAHEAAVKAAMRTSLDSHLEAVTELLAAHQEALTAHVDTELAAHQEKVVSSLVSIIPPAGAVQRGKKT